MSGTKADTISFMNWFIFGIIFNLKTCKMNELFLKDECFLALTNIIFTKTALPNIIF